MTTTAHPGFHLFLEEDMATYRELPFCGGQAVVFSQCCPTDPDRINEDGAAVLPGRGDQGLLVVADGVGGQRAGAQASNLAVNLLATSVRRTLREHGELRTAVLNGFEAANHAVAALGVGAGTTLAVVEIQGTTVRPYHVGDSMILVVGQRGKVKLQSVDHSPTGYAVHAGLLDEGDALHHAERHLVLNLVGSPDMRIEMGMGVQLDPLDTLLVASDGVSDNLSPDEIVNTIRKGPLDEVARALASQCHQRMLEPVEGQPSKPDDLTFLLFRRGKDVRRTSPSQDETP